MKIVGVILVLMAIGAFGNDSPGVGIFLVICALAAFGSGPKWRKVGDAEIWAKKR